MLWLILHPEVPHFLQRILQCAFEGCERLLTDLLLNHRGTVEVNEHIFLISRAVHHIVWLDVAMDDVLTVQDF